MKFGVLGSGMVGRGIAAKLVELGNDVMIGTRDVETLMASTASDFMGNPPFPVWHLQNSGVKVGSFAEAAVHGEVLFNATNGSGSLPALNQAGESNLNGKLLIDISNPLDFSQGMPPFMSIVNTDSLGEQIQRAYPDARVVKSLNTTTAALMVNPGLLADGDHTIFVSGNDDDAKAQATEILKSFGWSDIIDLGDITTARGTEMLVALWLRVLGVLQTPMFNFKVVR